MKRSNLDKEKIQNAQFEEKRSTKKCHVGAESRAQGEPAKEKPNAKCYKGSSDLMARSHPANLQAVKGNEISSV